MAEKRKATLTFMLRIPSKKITNKIELFPAGLWREKFNHQSYGYYEYRYRVRVNGAWFSLTGAKYSFYTKWEFRDMLWKSIPF